MGIAVKVPDMQCGYGAGRRDVAWEDLTPVYEDPKGRGTVARIFTAKDCETFGMVMGHCAGSHAAMILSSNWYFFSVFDEKWHPHTSIHARRLKLDEAAYKKAAKTHGAAMFSNRLFAYDGYGAPDYAIGYIDPPKDAKIPPEPEKYSEEWYNWRAAHGRDGARKQGYWPFKFEDETLVLLAAHVRGQATNGKTDASQVTKEWFLANKIKGADLVPANTEQY